MSRSWTFGLTLLALSAFAPHVFAQTQTSSAPTAHLSYVDGRVVVEHDTTAEDGTGDTPLSAGDRVRTEDGRAEILTDDMSVVDLDEQTTIDLQSEGLFRLMAGRLVVVGSGSTALQVDTPAGTVFINEPGEYRIGLIDDEGRPTLELAVVRGRAEIASDVERLTVETGERAWARVGEAPSYPVAFNSAQSDAFYDWASDRAGSRRGTTSAQYVPASLTQYSGTFDSYGSWNYEPTYGYVWYPRVAVGWRPYYSGRWRHYGGWGWTWTGGDPWAWPTHHYGRWGVSTAGLWFWIPGSVWAGAWVDWQFSSSYVSWCPLGFNNHPVYGWYGGYYGHGGGHGHGYHGGHDGDHWHGWTVVNRDHFGGYRSVNHVAVDGHRVAVDRSTGAGFAHGAPPRPVAVPRGSGPDGFFADRGQSGPSGFRGGNRSAAQRGGMAVPRNGFAANSGAANPNGSRAVPRGGTVTLGNGRVYHVPPAVGEDTRGGTTTGTDRAGGAGGSRGYATPRTDASSRTWGAGNVQRCRPDCARYGHGGAARWPDDARSALRSWRSLCLSASTRRDVPALAPAGVSASAAAADERPHVDAAAGAVVSFVQRRADAASRHAVIPACANAELSTDPGCDVRAVAAAKRAATGAAVVRSGGLAKLPAAAGCDVSTLPDAELPAAGAAVVPACTSAELPARAECDVRTLADAKLPTTGQSVVRPRPDHAELPGTEPVVRASSHVPTTGAVVRSRGAATASRRR